LHQRRPCELASTRLVGFGAVLLAAPGTIAQLWPWKLTTLVAQATAAWLIVVVYGRPGEQVKEALIALRPVYMSHLAGFAR
jgi:hypothetical protein